MADQDNPPTRRELIAQIKHTREIGSVVIVAASTIVWLLYQTKDVALRLQAKEYERRLISLNHAHEQAVEAQAKTVPRETYETYIKEQEKKLEELKISLHGEVRPLQDRKQFDSGRDLGILSLGVTVGGILVGIISKVLFG